MNVTATQYQVDLIDRVVGEGKYGKDRSEVLNSVAFEHAMYLAVGGRPDDTRYLAAGGPPDADGHVLEVARPRYGRKRESMVLQPITGKAVPVYRGEVLRIAQVEGGQCVDFNGYSLSDYREHLSCGFNRSSGMPKGKGSIVWSGSPRARPMYAVLHCDERFEQHYEGHRCTATLWERGYGFVGHPNCQDTFAEAIREYGLTPDDVHTSYNLWMYVTAGERGRQIHWNEAQKGDYVDLLALFDTLSVPVVCGGDLNACNNFDYAPIEISIFEPSPSTTGIVDLIQGRYRYQSQAAPADFKVKEIRARRDLARDPDYRPQYIPAPRRVALEVNVTPETTACLERLMKTGVYGTSADRALIAAFVRWYNVNRVMYRPPRLSIREE